MNTLPNLHSAFECGERVVADMPPVLAGARWMEIDDAIVNPGEWDETIATLPGTEDDDDSDAIRRAIRRAPEMFWVLHNIATLVIPNDATEEDLRNLIERKREYARRIANLVSTGSEVIRGEQA